MNNSQIKQVFGIKEIDSTVFWAFKCNLAWNGVSGGANFISYQSLNFHLPPWVVFLPPENTSTIISSFKKANCWKNSTFFALKN